MTDTLTAMRIFGGVMAIYGFFLAAYPDRYAVPILSIYLPAYFTTQNNPYFGFLFVVVGIFLFTRKRPIF